MDIVARKTLLEAVGAILSFLGFIFLWFGMRGRRSLRDFAAENGYMPLGLKREFLVYLVLGTLLILIGLCVWGYRFIIWPSLL